MSVLVTVGTTSFEDLIQEVDSNPIKDCLKQKGYNEIICQIGTGAYVPSLPNFKTIPNLSQFIADSSLIISHAGAGTILDVLRMNKKLIVVVNQKLMNNHQIEIAETLHNKKHLLMCFSSAELLKTLHNIESFHPVPLPEPNTQGFLKNIRALLGFCN